MRCSETFLHADLKRKKKSQMNACGPLQKIKLPVQAKKGVAKLNWLLGIVSMENVIN